MAELSGSLGSTEILAVIRLLAEVRQTGSLQLSRDSWSARLDLLEGRVVAATFRHERGLGALTALWSVIDDAEFVYTEGPAPAVHELDLRPEELRGHLALPADAGAALHVANPSAPVLACPKLGFGDDPTSHFSQPTGVHRCYASGSAKAVSMPEQGEFCLSGQFQDCPRLQAAATAKKDGRAAGTIGRDHLAVETPRVPAAGSGSGLIDRVLPPVSIGLFIAALIAVLLVFVRPRLGGSESVTAPATDAIVVTAVAAAQPTPPPRPAEPTPAATSAVAAIPQPPPPTPAPRIRPTVVPTVVPTPLPTVPPAVTQLAGSPNALGILLLDAQFSVPQPGWAENAPIAAWSDGAYRLTARVPARFVAVGAPVSEPIGDVTVNATFHKVGGPPGGGYGLILRDQEPGRRDGTNQSGNFYVLEVGDRGDVGMWRREDNRWVDVLSWTHSDAVHPGGTTNELTARAVGDQFTLIVNGVEVATQSDSTLSVGGVGVFVGGDANDVAINRFRVTVPEQVAD